MAKTPESRSDESPANKKSKAGKATPAALINTTTETPQVNLIQFTVDPVAPEGGSTKEPQKEQKESPASPEKSAASAAEPSLPTHQIPDAVLERFIKIGNNFYFPDGAEAFQYRGNRLTTRSENAVVIQGMVAIAQTQAKDGTVTVKGSDFFRKEAWFAASLAGLKVEGYEPTELERERLARAAARRAGLMPEGEKGAQSPAPGEAPKRERKASDRSPESELVSGRLVDHGAAHYKHNPKEDVSYFVRIETPEGDRDIWGVDLERAFRNSLSTPGIGDQVGVRAIGKDTVTVLAAERDAKGNEIGRKPLNTHRNQWIVERQDFLDRRAQMAQVFRDPAIIPEEGVRRHPELAGTYQALQLGQLVGDDQYANKSHREQWVEHLRADLARRIEYGQALETLQPRMREQREPDRDFNPTR